MTSPSESSSLSGARVVFFEARMAGPMADMIAKQGGDPLPAPALREIPLGDNPEVAAFAERLMAGGFDVVIFETGVGVRFLAQVIESRLPRESWIEALSRTRVVARGPKPLAALRELKARVDLQVPTPNTWHETLALLDDQLPVAGLCVAVQEFGKPNIELVEGLEQRGATVARVPVYRWALPEDLGPLRLAIDEIAQGRVDVALFTSAQQVEHLLQVASHEAREAELRRAFGDRTVVGSIGPTTSETLRAHDLPVDIEPEYPKLGHLISAVATGWRGAGKVLSQ
ncbi:MAG: uroporphyrinogen-III synthase [Isosphaeraceae bacterium]